MTTPLVSTKVLAAKADLYFSTREKRYALQKQVAALEEAEKALKTFLIDNISVSDATGVAGRLCRVTVMTKDVPVVEDWDALYAYILKNAKRQPGVWALLQRRVGEKTVADVWSEGKSVPGVGKFHAKTLSVNKVGG